MLPKHTKSTLTGRPEFDDILQIFFFISFSLSILLSYSVLGYSGTMTVVATRSQSEGLIDSGGD